VISLTFSPAREYISKAARLCPSPADLTPRCGRRPGQPDCGDGRWAGAAGDELTTELREMDRGRPFLVGVS
jgi:hypothetical protein